MSDLTFDMQLRPSEYVLIQELEGESVLLDVDRGQYFGLDEVGTRMWALLAGSASVESAYQTLLSEYDVEPERLRSDLADLVRKLLDAGLMRVAGPSAPRS